MKIKEWNFKCWKKSRNWVFMLHITGSRGVEFSRVAYKTIVYEWKSRRWVSSVEKKSRKWNIYFAYNCKSFKSRSWISGVAYECINKNQGDKF